MFMPDETLILLSEIISKLRNILPSIRFSFHIVFLACSALFLMPFKCGSIFHAKLHSNPPHLEAFTFTASA